MKPSVIGLLIAAAAFGASTVYLSAQLRDERMQTDQLAAETRDLHARIAELEKLRGERHQAAMNPFSPVMSPPAPRSGHRVRVEETAGPAGGFVEGVTINAPPQDQELLNKIRRAQVRAHNKQLYAEIGPRLNLSKDEANKLIDLLTEQQLQSGMSWNDSSGMEDALRQMAEKERQNKANIAELIGAENAASLEEYQQSLPARQELDMLARQFDGADAPLSEEQRNRLLDIFVDERTRVPAPKMSDATSFEEHSKAYTAWQANYDESVASQARALLSTDQLSTYNEYRDWQSQMRAQMGVVHSGRIQRMPGGPNVMFTTTAPAVSADLVLTDPADDKPRK